MSDYRCPHGRVHIKSDGTFSYRDLLDQYGNDPGYKVFAIGVVCCAVCNELRTKRVMAEIEVGEVLLSAYRQSSPLKWVSPGCSN